MQGLDDEARALLHKERFAVLSTMSAQDPGYPFGSLVPYLPVEEGRVLLFLSSLAVHQRNLREDPRCSLMVLEPGHEGDLQEYGRLTLLCDAAPLPPDGRGTHGPPWLARHPEAEPLFDMNDFGFWSLLVRRARLVAGFGKMGWLEGGAWMTRPR